MTSPRHHISLATGSATITCGVRPQATPAGAGMTMVKTANPSAPASRHAP